MTTHRKYLKSSAEVLHSNGKNYIFSDTLLSLLFGGDILDRSLGRFERWESDWTCDTKLGLNRGREGGEALDV